VDDVGGRRSRKVFGINVTLVFFFSDDPHPEASRQHRANVP